MKLHQILNVALLALALPVAAGEVVKDNNNTTLSSAASWVGGGVPGAGDVAVWNSIFANTATGPALGASPTWGGLRIADPALCTSPQIRAFGSTNFLTLGSGGIDMSLAAGNFSRDFLIGPKLALGASQGWNVATGRVLTLSGELTGSGLTLTKAGGGTLKLTGAVAIAPNLSLAEGTLQASPASGTQTLAGTLAGTGTLLKDGAGALTLAAANSGFGGALTLTAGQLNLNHAAALGSGSLTISGGSLDNASGGPLTLAGGSTQNWTGDFAFLGSASLNLGGGEVALSGSRIVTVAANTLTIGGNLTGAGGLTKAGAGTLVIAGGGSTYAGATWITGGSVQMNGSHLSNGQFTLYGGTSATFAGTETLTGGIAQFVVAYTAGDATATVSGTVNLHSNAGGDTLIGQNATGANGVLHIVNGGVVDVTGAGFRVGNSGGTAAPSGTLTMDPGSTLTLDTADTGLGFILGNGATGSTGTVNLDGGVLTTGRIIRKGTGTGTFNFNGGTLKAGLSSGSFMSGLTAAYVRAGGARIDTNTLSVTVAQPLLHEAALGATADGGLTVTGGGTLTLSGANTYTGPTIVNSGTLALGTGGSVAGSPVITLATDATLDGLNGTVLSTGQTLTGTGTLAGKITVGAGATLSPGGSVDVGTLGGSADLTLAGNAKFRINKLGTTIFGDSVTANSVRFGGTLTVTAGGAPLTAGNSIKLFDAVSYSGSFAAFNLPDVSFQGLFWDTSTLAQDGTLSLVSGVPMPVFNPPGGACFDSQSVSITGVGGATIHYTTDGSDPLTSPTTLSGASPVMGVSVPAGSTGFTLRAYASVAGYPNSAVLEASYDLVDTGIWTTADSGNWADGSNWFSGLVAQGAGRTADFSTVGLSATATVSLDSSRAIGNLKFGDTRGLFDWNVQALAGATLTLASASQPIIQVVNRTVTIATDLAGSQGFEKTGGGTLTLTGANNLTGGTTITGGSLRIGNGGTTGTLGSAVVANNAILELYRSDTYTISNPISGTGKIYVKPGGTVSLTGALTCAALRIHEAGSRTVILGGAQPNTINVLETSQDGNCTLAFAKPAGVNAFSGPVLDVGNGYNSTSHVRLDNDEQIPNTTRVNLYGTQPYYSGHTYLDLNGHNETIAGVVSSNVWTYVQNGAATPSVLTLAGGDTYGFVGSVANGSTGTLSIVKTGSGTQTFSGNLIDYTGTTTVNAGRLVFSANDDCWTTRIEIAAGATVEVARDNADAFENQGNCTITGAGTYLKTGNGLMDMNWSNHGTVAMTSGGRLWVKEGTLRLGYGAYSDWTNNKADLTVSAGAIFDLWDNNTTTAGVVVDALDGGGQIVRSTYGNTGNLTVGVDGGSGDFSGSISNDSGIINLIKAGAGTQTLSGANTYTGSTTVTGGTLLVNGSLAAASAITATAGATLGGSGAVAGTVAVNAGAFLAPGSTGVGTLTTGNLTLAGTYQCQLDGASTDKIATTGTLNLTGSTLAIAVLNPPTAGSYVIATYTTGLIGTFGGSLPAGYTVDYGTANQIRLTVTASGFGAWMAGYGLTGANALPGADPDHDGLANAVEFVLGGNPATVMDAALLPTVAVVTNPGGTVPAGSYMKITYRRTPASAYLNPAVEFTANVTGAWTTAVAGQGGVVQVVAPGFYLTPTPADKVEVYIPRAGNEVKNRLFGRLRVVVP